MPDTAVVLIKGTGENAGYILCLSAYPNGVELQVGREGEVEIPAEQETLVLTEILVDEAEIRSFLTRMLGDKAAQGDMRLFFSQLLRFAFRSVQETDARRKRFLGMP